MKSYRLSKDMAKFLNKQEASRVDITRAMYFLYSRFHIIIENSWAHVKDKNLQDPQDKRMITIDDQLRPLFQGKDKIHMFDIAKHINNHVKKD